MAAAEGSGERRTGNGRRGRRGGATGHEGEGDSAGAHDGAPHAQRETRRHASDTDTYTYTHGLLLLLALARRLARGERLDDVVHALGLEHDLRPVAARLVRELGAELVDVHVLGPFNRLAYPHPHTPSQKQTDTP